MEKKRERKELIRPGSQEWSDAEPAVKVFRGGKTREEGLMDEVRGGLFTGPQSVPTLESHTVTNAKEQGEFHGKPVASASDIAYLKLEGQMWRKKVADGEIQPIPREDLGLITPLEDNPHANRVLFMLSTVGDDIYARSIGTEKGGYVSNIIHGVPAGDGIRWDREPLFSDGVSREDPRVSKLDERIYMTYTQVEPEKPFTWEKADAEDKQKMLEALKAEGDKRGVDLEWVGDAQVERDEDNIVVRDEKHVATLGLNDKGDRVVVNVDQLKSFDFEAEVKEGNTIVFNEVTGVGLASMPTDNPTEVTDHGLFMQMEDEGVECKDAVILPEKVNGKVCMLVRLKPGIQAIYFDSMQDVIKLTENQEERDSFWQQKREEYMENPQQFNHLHPNSPEMKLMEARWKPILDERIDELVSEYHEDEGTYDFDRDSPHWYGTGPAPIKVEKDGRKYWLSFPHRGQVIGHIREEGLHRKELEHERPDDLKFYCVLATLHDYDDPTKLVAVSPLPVSMPSVERYEQRSGQGMKHPFNHADAVPHVAITAGAVADQVDGRDKLTIPVGVNDVYTVMKRFDKDELIDWMLKDGKVGKTT